MVVMIRSVCCPGMRRRPIEVLPGLRTELSTLDFTEMPTASSSTAWSPVAWALSKVCWAIAVALFDSVSTWARRVLYRLSPMLIDMYEPITITARLESTTVIATMRNCSDVRQNRVKRGRYDLQSRPGRTA